LLWTARINEEKNVAAAIALAKHLKQPLKIAGRITDQHYFDTAVKPHLNDQIQYIGHATQQTLKRLASRAIAFLATAQWQEPFGLNTLEMLAAGVPVVGFASAIPPDLRDQHVSIAVDSNYWHDLIEPLQSVQSTNAKQCRHFAQTMNIENMTKKYLNLYESLAMNVQQNTPTIDAIEELLPHSVPVEAA
jgi:glycosyltransferase involved in cell wall biosynthesis